MRVDIILWFALPERRNTPARFALYLAIAGGSVFMALFLVWRIQDAWLLAFAAVVCAVLLRIAAEPFEQRLGVSRHLSLSIVAALLLIIIAAFAWLLGHQLWVQFNDLSTRLKTASHYAHRNFELTLPGLDPQQSGKFSISGLSDLLQQLFGTFVSVGRTLVGGLLALVLVVVGAFFLAAQPALYRRGLTKLFPINQHARVEDALRTAGQALRLWLLAQLLSMAAVGVMVLVGTWLIGLPAPLALGLLAGVTEFIPLIGPILGAAPAVLLAITQGVWTTVWTVLLFVIIQQIESNLIQPLIQRHMVKMPPALLLFAVMALGLLFGIIGLVVAAPLTVVLYVLVQKLFVCKTLGEGAYIPGES